MARKKAASTYETQAKLSVILAAVGGVGTLGAIGLLVRNFTDMETFWVVYNRESMFMPLLGGTLLVALLTGALGFLAGFNSAGQRRNSLSRLSWLGFFLSAGVVTLALCAGLFFFFTRYEVEI